MSILGRDNNHPSGQTARVTIERNLFQDARSGIRVTGGVDGALTVRRATGNGSKISVNTTRSGGAISR